MEFKGILRKREGREDLGGRRMGNDCIYEEIAGFDVGRLGEEVVVVPVLAVECFEEEGGEGLEDGFVFFLDEAGLEDCEGWRDFGGCGEGELF